MVPPALHLPSPAKVLVIDNGGGYLRIGFMGDLTPRINIPNCVAQSRKQTGKEAMGAEAIAALGTYSLRRPITAGILTDGFTQAKLWRHAFSKLNVADPRNLGVVITESVANPYASNKLLFDLIFQEFKFDRCAILQASEISHLAFPPAGESVNLISNERTSDDVKTEMDVDKKEDASGAKTEEGDGTASRVRGRSPRKRRRLAEFPPPLVCSRYEWAANSKQKFKYAAYHEVEVEPTAAPSPARLIVDLGYSGHWCVPVFRSVLIDYGLTRGTVGGHILDTALRRAICHRHMKQLNADLLVEKLREQRCRVALDFDAELKEFSGTRPVIKGPGDTLGGPQQLTIESIAMASENKAEIVTVCEMMFRPNSRLLGDLPRVPVGKDLENVARATEGWISRLGLPPSQLPVTSINRAGGLAESIVESIFSVPPILQSAMAGSILLVGGLSRTEGLIRRLHKELRAMLPAKWPIVIHVLEDYPEFSTWIGAAAWARTFFEAHSISRTEYNSIHKRPKRKTSSSTKG